MFHALLVATVLAGAERPKMSVLEVTTGSGVEASAAQALTDALTQEISARGFFDVISARDLKNLLGVERERQLLGCTESNCLTELAGAIGARFILSGQLSRLGEAYQLSIETLDTQKAKPIGRSTRIAPTLESLRAQIPWAVAEATGTPLPPEPSRVLPYSVLAAGCGALLAGGYFAVDGLSREGQINSTFQLAQGPNGPPLSTLAYYQQQANDAAARKTAGLIALGAGTALIGVGIYLLPAGAQGRLALVPTAGGAALAGAFP
jgi:hypothetical protein